MKLPPLKFPLSSQNQRVAGFEVPGDEYPWQYSLENWPKGTDLDKVIWAAYRQIFNEQQVIVAHRQTELESQLRHGQIVMRDFIRGLLLSDSFRRLNYEANNNYRFVELCLSRVLGRPAYNRQETLAWSVVIATQGLAGFVDALLSSEEYEENFGDFFIPYQRRRILPQCDLGDLPNARMTRYGSDRRDLLFLSGQLREFSSGIIDRSAAVYRRILFLVPAASVAILVAVLLFSIPT